MTEIQEANARLRTESESSNEIDPHFDPIIKLPLVNVSTNEENEEVLLKLRAKLYRFNSDDGPEWKERGTGEMKLLRHKENNSCRIVMRRDKTLKVCANHFLTPWMELKPSIGSEKAFVYTVAADFADEAPKSECLAIRFGTVDFAKTFKEKFNEAREIVKTKCKLYNGEDEDESSSNDDDDDDDEKENDKKAIEAPSSDKGDNNEELSAKITELNIEEKKTVAE